MHETKKSASEHYSGERGYQYITRFSGYEMGKIIQSEYFLPYTDNEKVILDFGCSEGNFLRKLPAKERIGVEVNPWARKKCEEHSVNEAIPIELHETLQTVENERVDVMISNHALEHVLNPYLILVEMLRVLKPNGCLALVVPFDDWRSGQNNKWEKENHDNHLYTWSPLNLGNLLTEAGFKVLKTELLTYAWTPKIFWINRLLGRKIFDFACFSLGLLKNRREILCVAAKPHTG